jgi:hypothetical protein
MLIRAHARDGKIWLAILMVALLLPATAASVPAMASVCVPVTGPDGVVIPCDTDGDPGNPGGPGDGDGSGGGGGEPATCEFRGEEIPCSGDYGSWNGRCYTRAAAPQPPKDASVWEGNDDGVIIECTSYDCVSSGDVDSCPGHSFYWSADAPVPVGPSAEELAQRALVALNLKMGQIGSTPPATTSSADAVGAIGLPIWLWIANPAENTIGPITGDPEPGLGGLSVTARGTLDRVEWTLTSADGSTIGAITCDGANAPGTPYDGRNSAEPSPTCGFGPDLNNSPGTLTLTGAAHWVVEWQSNEGQSGVIPFTPPPNSTQIRIGELQALVRD